MSLINLITESTNFRLSYHVPFNRIPFLLDKLTTNNDHLETKEDDESGDIFVVDKNKNELFIRYDFENKTLYSDMPFNDLLNYGSD